MAVDFGNTYMEGSIEPTVKVQAPVQDDSGAVLAQALAPAANAIGGVIGGIFKQSQQDDANKVLVDYELRNLRYAEAVAQGQMDPNEFRIRAMALRREFLSRAPALQEDFDKIYSNLVNTNGLGHVGVTGDESYQREKAFADKAYSEGFDSPEAYRRALGLGNQVVESTRHLTLLQNEGATITQSQLNLHLRKVTEYADVAYPAAQQMVNTYLDNMEANPSAKGQLLDELNFKLNSIVNDVKSMGGPADSTYITAPIVGLIESINEYASGTKGLQSVKNQLETVQTQYDLMAVLSEDYGPKIAASRVLRMIGGEDFQYKFWENTDVTKGLLDMYEGQFNPVGSGNETKAGTVEAVVELTRQAISSEEPEVIDEMNKYVGELIDSAFKFERTSEQGAMAYKALVDAIGRPEIQAWIAKHGLTAQHAASVKTIFEEQYARELVPVIDSTWNSPAALPVAAEWESQVGNDVPMSDLLEARWNGNAVEFVPAAGYEADARVVALANRMTTGSGSIGDPLNRLIKTYASLTGQDAGKIYEEDFANRLFGGKSISDRVNRALDAGSDPSYTPEEDTELTLSDFNPVPIQSNLDIPEIDVGSFDPLDSGTFVDPNTNPAVDKQVLDKFAGRRLPVSIRNNNMGAVSITGNIESSWAAKQPGFVGATARPANEGGYYARYATPEHGVAAASKLLELYGRQGVDSPGAIVRKWSADRAAHASYANTLVKYLKEAGFDVTANTRIDLSDPKVRMAVLKAKSSHEAGAGRPVYNDQTFLRGVTYQL